MTILIIAEHDNTELRRSTLHAVTAASQLEGEIHMLVAGKNSDSVANSAATVSGVSKILHADDTAYKHGLAENIAPLIAQVAKRHGKQIGVFLKIDVGLRRCGIVEDDPLILKLATAIQEESILNFLGLLSHAGHAYGAENRDHVWKIAKNEHQILSRVRQKLEAVQIEVKEISVGSTPTILASDTYATITEIRPGNYVFMDRTPLRLGLIQPQEIALSILATVVSVNPECFIIDAGSKVLSSDQGAHGIAGMEGYGLVYPLDCFEDFGHEMIISKLSEEHGFVARRNFDLPIGSVVRIKPNHSCSVANLANFYVVSNGDKIIDKWKIDARGQVS